MTTSAAIADEVVSVPRARMAGISFDLLMSAASDESASHGPNRPASAWE
ncbi:MAG: hypothetical protein GY911_15470 [Actinomycetales bacterium]|nr:hypothetical protein [Actinomycetales bacterium]